jgi:hypothetical protein
MSMKKVEAKFVRLAAVTTVVAFALVAVATTPALAEEGKKVDPFAGMKKIEDAKVGIAYIDPDADFSVFKRVAISDPYVAFRADWRRDQNRDRMRPITVSQMEKIKSDVAKLLKEVFTERLEADDGYEVTLEAGYDVLLLKPAIVDLDLNLPETGPRAATVSITASSGAATLYIELFDSVTGDNIGRAADRQTASTDQFQVTGPAFGEAAARAIFEGWADQLRAFLDEHYKE